MAGAGNGCDLLRGGAASRGITVGPDARLAGSRIFWQGGAATELTMPTTKKGGCVAVAGEETIQQIN